MEEGESAMNDECKEKLARLLVEGDSNYIEEIHRSSEACAELSESKRKACYSEAIKYLEKSFHLRFPWMKVIAPADKDRECTDDLSFEERAREMYNYIEEYDLLKANSLFRSICVLVCKYVEEGVSLRMVADQLGISTDYAGRIFKRRSDVHFATFVMQIKMERGKELLRSTRLRNYEISTRLGYSNPDYFRQLFKAYTGLTPTDYRNMCRYKRIM